MSKVERKQYTTEDGVPTGVRTDTPMSQDVSMLLLNMRDIAHKLTDLAGWSAQLAELHETDEELQRLAVELGGRTLALRNCVDEIEGLRAKAIERDEA